MPGCSFKGFYREYILDLNIEGSLMVHNSNMNYVWVLHAWSISKLQARIQVYLILQKCTRCEIELWFQIRTTIHARIKKFFRGRGVRDIHVCGGGMSEAYFRVILLCKFKKIEFSTAQNPSPFPDPRMLLFGSKSETQFWELYSPPQPPPSKKNLYMAS